MAAFFLRKFLNDADLAAITAAIGEAEKSTTGEIRVCIRHRRHWKERKLTLHELALGEFLRLHMERTSKRTGVLILLLFNERRFHIIGDEGIHAKVGDALWGKVAAKMGEQFRSGHFRQGIVAGVEEVGKELATHFPRTMLGPNELPDDVIIE